MRRDAIPVPPHPDEDRLETLSNYTRRFIFHYLREYSNATRAELTCGFVESDPETGIVAAADHPDWVDQCLDVTFRAEAAVPGDCPQSPVDPNRVGTTIRAVANINAHLYPAKLTGPESVCKYVARWLRGPSGNDPWYAIGSLATVPGGVQWEPLGCGPEGGTNSRSPFYGFRPVSERPPWPVDHSLSNGLRLSVHSQPGRRVWNPAASAASRSSAPAGSPASPWVSTSA